MKNYLAAIALLSLTAGCAIEPLKRPLTPEAASKLPELTVHVGIDPRGVGVEYFAQDSSAAGAQYGLLGALVSAGLDAAMNAGPMKIAEISADQTIGAYQLEELRTEFRSHLDVHLKTQPPFDRPATLVVMKPDQKIEAQAFTEPAVFAVQVKYALSQDLHYLHVSADAHLFDKSTIAPTPAKKSSRTSTAKKDQGLVYRNHFGYYSERLGTVPGKTQAEIDAEISDIRKKYDTGRRLSDTQRQKMNKEIAAARKPASPAVKAEYLVKQWMANDAALLKEKIREGTLEVVKLMAKDIGDASAFNTKAKLPPKTVLEQGDSRVLVRYNVLPFQGALGSEPPNFVATPTNGVMYSKKAANKSVATK